MFKTLSAEEFKELAEERPYVAVYRQIPSDQFTAVGAFEALKKPGAKACLLDSISPDIGISRYSFLCMEPRIELEAFGDELLLSEGKKQERSQGNPMDKLREILSQHQTAVSEALPPLVGGAIGFLTYDAVRYFERIPDKHAPDPEVPDFCFNFYDTIVTLDHDLFKATVTHIVKPGAEPAKAYKRAIDHIDRIIDKLNRGVPPKESAPQKKSQSVEITPDLDDEDFCGMVELAKDLIREGEVFQVVLSRTFRARTTVPPFDIYRAMRMVTPSPYMFFIDQGSYAIAGASPERFVSCKKGVLEQIPLAGTRPRGIGAEDKRLEQDLTSDPKELAEHLMLVDLSRNDLGSVAKPGSVKVLELAEVRRYSHVMHMASRVYARLGEPFDALDAIRASLPAGTLSGAPKIRAMEIIDQLEASRRGIYGGAICYIDNNGDMDSCIIIRTALLKKGSAIIRAGAGIVADSVPQKEADETRHKARGVLKAIALAEEGIACC